MGKQPSRKGEVVACDVFRFKEARRHAQCARDVHVGRVDRGAANGDVGSLQQIGAVGALQELDVKIASPEFDAGGQFQNAVSKRNLSPRGRQ